MDDLETIIERDFNLEKKSVKNDLDDFTMMLMDTEDNKDSNQQLSDIQVSSLMTKYLDSFGLSIYDSEADNFVPIDFKLAENNDCKIAILNEAIEKKIKIEETSLYPALVEHVDFNGDDGFFLR